MIKSNPNTIVRKESVMRRIFTEPAPNAHITAWNLRFPNNTVLCTQLQGQINGFFSQLVRNKYILSDLIDGAMSLLNATLT